MNVKELKEKLNEFPDDMEVIVYDEEYGLSDLNDINTAELFLINYDNYREPSWEFPTKYNRNIIKTEKCLILNW